MTSRKKNYDGCHGNPQLNIIMGRYNCQFDEKLFRKCVPSNKMNVLRSLGRILNDGYTNRVLKLDAN